MFLLSTRIANGATQDEINPEGELSDEFNLSEHERAQLLSELKRTERVA
jgi:hypothetical protein